MDADRDSDAPQPEISAHVASCVIRVGELDRSLKFYGDVFSCNVVARETDMAMLFAPNGFHIYLHAPSLRRRAASTPPGSSTCCGPPTPNPICRSCPAAARLRLRVLLPHRKRSDRHRGLDPDRGRVTIGYPSPCQLTRTVFARRLRA
jgi:catechol 2,3-dioxygenase-like lactoylglutathione lyase family enzyme